MKLRLIKVVAKTTSTQAAYSELTFFNPSTNREIRYWLWSFVHNNTNNLAHIWDKVDTLCCGTLYEVHFKKAHLGGRVQHIITTLDEVDVPVTFID